MTPRLAEVARLLTESRAERLPPTAMERAKECVLDTLGCALGAVGDPVNEGVFSRILLLSGVGSAGGGRQRPGGAEADPGAGLYAAAWGKGYRLPLLMAALYNGMLAHTLELDDVHRRSKVHASAVVVPAALSTAQAVGASGVETLRAVVLGAEVAHRIGSAIGVAEHRRRGWHASSTAGVFGAAAAAGLLLGLDPLRMSWALGLAGTQSSGVWAFLSDGADSKRFHTGMAAHDGILAANLASAGLSGPTWILEAPDGGLFAAMSSGYDLDAVLRDWGEAYFIESVSLKRFACCRSIHPALDAVLALRETHGISSPEEVERIDIETYTIAVMQCGSPEWPQTPMAARFNMRYAVTVALADGEALPAQFDQHRIGDSRLRDASPIVAISASEEFDREYPEKWGCRVTMQLRSEKRITKTVWHPKGDPENPLLPEEIDSKFLSLARPVLGSSKAEQLAKAVRTLERCPNARDLLM